jgi:hypothetical protein
MRRHMRNLVSHHVIDSPVALQFSCRVLQEAVGATDAAGGSNGGPAVKAEDAAAGGALEASADGKSTVTGMEASEEPPPDAK